MTVSAEWLEKRRRLPYLTLEPIPLCGGCPPESVKAIEEYLDGRIIVSEAAKLITAVTYNVMGVELRYLWILLANIIVELPDDSTKAVDLVDAIRSQLSTSTTDWQQHFTFACEWYDEYKDHLHAGLPWEEETLSKDRQVELRAVYEASGRAEAEMFLRGLPIPQWWGYKTIAMVCWGREGIDVLLSNIYPWAKVASAALKDQLELGKIEVHLYESYEVRRATMEEHWEHWTKKYLELSKDGSRDPKGRILSSEGRMLAGLIYHHMRERV